MSPSYLRITLAWSEADEAVEAGVEVIAGTTISDLVASTAFASRVPSRLLSEAAAIGVWGKKRAQSYQLREGDRVEIYAPLKVDPKEQRRQRAR